MDVLFSGVVSAVTVIALVVGPFALLAALAATFGSDSRRTIADDRPSTVAVI